MASKYQKRHYEDVAGIIAFAQTVGYTPHPLQYATEFAKLFERDNPNFDRERFLKACGLENA